MVIKHLKLYCAYLEEQKHFYTKKFNFQLVKESDKAITLSFGDSLLTFTENRLQNAYYHYAFNVPYKLIKSAQSWVSKRVELMQYKNKELIDFDSWNAKSIYFLDPAGNVVEFIGRKDLTIEEEGETDARKNFKENRILHLSEVGVPVFQVSSAFELLKKKASIPEFDCKDNTFCACGDNRGLFILVDKAEKTWFPGTERAKGFPLEVIFSSDGNNYTLKAEGGQLSVELMEKD